MSHSLLFLDAFSLTGLQFEAPLWLIQDFVSNMARKSLSFIKRRLSDLCKLISPRTKWLPFHRMHLVNENVWLAIYISLKLPNVPIDNKPALVQEIAWRRICDKPLSEPMLTRLIDAYMSLWGEMRWLGISSCNYIFQQIYNAHILT